MCWLDFFPKQEMKITAQSSRMGRTTPRPVVGKPETGHPIGDGTIENRPKNIEAIGISYQMHGLVWLTKTTTYLRPSIIWCDSRAAAIGDKAFDAWWRTLPEQLAELSG
jgi:xylulokinase